MVRSFSGAGGKKERSLRLVTVFAVVALLVGALVLWSRSRARPTVDGDLAVLQQLEKAGSDLSKHHPIEFFLYFPSREVADEAAAQIRTAGFGVRVELGADQENWLCLATKEMVPVHRELVQVRARFGQLASSLGGEYDGWGTPVVP